MDEGIKYQYENAKNLYLNFYDKLITMATLINSGGIISIATLYSGETDKKYHHLYQILCYFFYPLNVALYLFSLSLFLGLLILFVDFSYMSLEFRKLKSHIQGEKSYTPNSFTNMIVTIQWLMGIVAIVFTIIGGVFGILSVSN